MDNVININRGNIKMIIKLNKTIYSGTAKEIVGLMKSSSIFTEGQPKDCYMEAVRDRVDALTGKQVRVTTCRTFIFDLCLAGVATKIA